MSSASSPLQRVVLTGFMGSGKTTVGRLLAAHLGWTFVDLDDEITVRSGLAVPDLFARFGEPHFRALEASALAECLERARLVLALGGGAPETEGNRLRLRASPATAVVYLSGPFDVLQARCLTQASQPDTVARPVFADATLAHGRFTRREPLYAEIATLTLDTTGHTAEDLAEALVTALGLLKPQRETP